MLDNGSIIVGRYEIISYIGRGGMAKIYKAADLRLNRMVAIKVLNEEYSTDESFIKKFNAEAKAAATITHPNIVNVYDVGQDGDLHFIVMELIEGITLKSYIQSRGKLDSAITLKVAMQICLGIKSAHDNGIIHRDIKPQNIVISNDSNIKVADFGIARVSNSETINSEVVGSVHYMSPEQARSGYSDEKSDIYSLGITMYEMVTGVVPFDGENNASVIYSQVNSLIKKPSRLNPMIYPGLERIILKATSKRANDRYQSIEYMMQDIDFVLKNPTKLPQFSELNKSDEGLLNPDEDIDDFMMDQDLEDDDIVNPKIKKIMNIMTIVGGVFVLLLLIFAIYKFGFSHKNSYNPDNVPNIVGMKYDEVQKLAKKENFTIVIKEYDREAPETEKDKILSQDPKPDSKWTDLKNKIINVVIAGNDDKKLPDFSAQPLDQVVKRLEKMELQYTTEELFDDSLDKGIVIKTNPAGGSPVPKNAVIIIYVSKGADKISLPDLRNLSKAEATSQLQSLGLNAIYEEKNGEKDKVVETSPPPGEKVVKKSSITLYIGNGKKEVEMPNITNQKADSAVRALTELKLQVSIEEVSSDAVKPGYVVSTSPNAGEKVVEQSTVIIYIAKSKGTAIPNVVGMDSKTAKAVLSNLGLGVSITKKDGAANNEVVVSQSPPAGTIVEPGNTVMITVGN